MERQGAAGQATEKQKNANGGNTDSQPAPFPERQAGNRIEIEEIPEGTENFPQEIFRDFSTRLLEWYRVHKRDLPWRKTSDPYRIWVSEIILQQTRVAQGLEYFNRFIERFPNIASLAQAPEDQVMNYWQGLGYYSRARNLHAAARDIMERFAGVFPREYRDVLSLKGIGEYTAAAICSFAYRAPHAVVDGNVYRVLARLCGTAIPIDTPQAKKYFTGLAAELLDKNFPDDYNQAIMDFGALQCVPQSPKCSVCPFRDICTAFREDRVDRLPVKQGKTVIKARYFNYFHIRCEGNILLYKRTGKDIWQNLYEFPLIETPAPVSFEQIESGREYRRLAKGVNKIKLLRRIPMPKHQLSHRTIYPVFYEMEWSDFPAEKEMAAFLTENLLEEDSAAFGETNNTGRCNGYLVVPENSLEKYPISRLTESYLEYAAGTLPF